MNAKPNAVLLTLLLVAGMLLSACDTAALSAPLPTLPQGWQLMTSSGQMVAVTTAFPQGNYWYLQFPTEEAAQKALGEGLKTVSVYAATAGEWAFHGIVVLGTANIIVNGGSIVQQLAEGPAELQVGDQVIYLNRITGQQVGFYEIPGESAKELAGRVEVKVQEHEANMNPTPGPNQSQDPCGSYQGPSNYRFKNGDALQPAPEGPLKDLLRPTSEKVYQKLQQDGVVVATAPSGVGKTELFAGKLPYRAYESGGIKTLLKEKGVSFGYFDGQGYSAFGDQAGTMFIQDWRGAGSPGVLIVDETQSMPISGLQAVAQLLGQGTKAIFIGGGMTSTASQFEAIKAHLAQAGITVPPGGCIQIPPFEMTDNQAAEFLTAHGDLSYEDGLAVANRLREANVPLTYRLLRGAVIKKEDFLNMTNDQVLEALSNQIYGIEMVPPQQ